MKNKYLKNSLFLFLIFTTLFLIPFTILYAQQKNPNYLTLLMFTPTLSVIITCFITKQPIPLEYLKFNFKKNKKTFILSYFLPPILAILGALFYFLIFPQHFDPMNSIYAHALQSPNVYEYFKNIFIMIPLAILLNPLGGLFQCLGEEFAWRGFLLKECSRHLSTKKAILLCGIIWGLWHSPIVFMGYNYGNEYPLLGVLMMIFTCIVLGTIESFLFLKSNSIWSAVFFHASINGMDKWKFSSIFMHIPANPFIGPDVIGIIGLSGFILLAIYLMRKNKI